MENKWEGSRVSCKTVALQIGNWIFENGSLILDNESLFLEMCLKIEIWFSKTKKSLRISHIYRNKTKTSKKKIRRFNIILFFSFSVSSKKQNRRLNKLWKQSSLIPTPPWTIFTWTCTQMITWTVTWSGAVTTGLGTWPIRYKFYRPIYGQRYKK